MLALPCLLLLYPVILERLTGWTYPMWFTPAILLAMSAIFATLVFLVPDGNPLLENRAGDYLGKISYSLYLLHFPILLMVERAGLAHGLGGLAFYLAATIAAASATYHLYEFPARRRIRAMWPPGHAVVAGSVATNGRAP